jgi:hypothetical protein
LLIDLDSAGHETAHPTHTPALSGHTGLQARGSEAEVIAALKQLACYELTADQVSTSSAAVSSHTVCADMSASPTGSRDARPAQQLRSTQRCSPLLPAPPLLLPQLERVPLGKRVKQLRRHESPAVQQQADRVLAKMRRDVTAACERANGASSSGGGNAGSRRAAGASSGAQRSTTSIAQQRSPAAARCH